MKTIIRIVNYDDIKRSIKSLPFDMDFSTISSGSVEQKNQIALKKGFIDKWFLELYYIIGEEQLFNEFCLYEYRVYNYFDDEGQYIEVVSCIESGECSIE